MKKQMFAIIALLVMSIVITVSQTFAQSAQIIKVEVPFAFSVNNKMLPAGTYIVKRTDDRGIVWTIQDSSQKVYAFLMARNLSATEKSSKGQMTFHRYGRRNFLSGFKTISYQIGLPASRNEKNLRRKLKENLAQNAEPEKITIEVALN